MENATDWYEWDAHVYHQLSDPQYAFGMKLLSSLPLQGDETILDAGCGSGRVTQEILKRVPQGYVIGLDRSYNMLQKARDVLGASAGTRAYFIQTDLQSFCLPQSVDGIFSSMAIHFVLDHRLLFKNLAKTLRPGGFLAVQMGASDAPLKDFWSKMKHMMTQAPYANLIRKWTEPFKQIEHHATYQHLQEAGFEKIQVESIDEPMNFTLQGYQDLIRMSMLKEPMSQLPTQDLQERFLEESWTLLDPAHLRHGPMPCLVCHARLPS